MAIHLKTLELMKTKTSKNLIVYSRCYACAFLFFQGVGHNGRQYEKRRIKRT